MSLFKLTLHGSCIHGSPSTCIGKSRFVLKMKPGIMMLFQINLKKITHVMVMSLPWASLFPAFNPAIICPTSMAPSRPTTSNFWSPISAKITCLNINELAVKVVTDKLMYQRLFAFSFSHLAQRI